MDDLLQEAAAEVEAEHAAKKKNTGDILLAAATNVEQDYEDDGFEEMDEAERTDLSREDVKNILRNAARSVDNDDAADARDALQDAARSLEPNIESEKNPFKNLHSSVDDDDIGDMLIRAADEVFDGKREYEDDKVEEGEPVESEESELEDDDDDDDDDTNTYDENHLLMISCYRKDIDSVEKHLRKGANCMYRDRHGWTPLHWAAAKGYDEILETLIMEYKGNNAKKFINCKDNITGWTPLHLACVGGHIDCISHLLDKGAKKNIKNNMNEIPWDCVGVSIRTPEGRRIAKLLGKWKEPKVEDSDSGKSRHRSGVSDERGPAAAAHSHRRRK